ncbi:MAG: tannase/feruloyl esterase family alpha/beta hydrolase [Gammaproteobacteria bacterium]|nr:tannase/feruloyl esterase family alpha/beta hydrolase [Gammaproteobacteria bacterium]
MKFNRLVLAISLGTAAGAVHAADRDCAALARYDDGRHDVKIDEARHYDSREVQTPFGPPQNLPAHCHIAGSFEHRTGADGKPYAIGFAINLPDNWNGRYLFQGGGGLNGVVREPTGSQASGTESALARGFAVVSNDTGHVASGFDASFMKDQQAMLNFQYQANAKVVDLTRPMVERYYGNSPHHSYFVGCSTGGREGMVMAQRFPQLFDGIVSGAPAMRTGVSNLALRWISNQLSKAVSNARDPFTPEEEKIVMDGLLARCDALDGQADGLIFNRTQCDFDPHQVSCSVKGGNQCLADAKADALAKAMSGPVTAGGQEVYVSFPWDTGIDDTAGLPGLLLAGGSPPEGGNGADLGQQNVDAEFFVASSLEEALGTTGTSYNVSSFVGKGGKHIFYHGESDAWFSANETVRYMGEMGKTNAWLAPAGSYSRLYLVPGMAHCAGGDKTPDSFDLLSPLVQWVEDDRAPTGVVATGRSMNGASRPLCPYPQYAHFNGGDPAKAESYVCRQP